MVSLCYRSLASYITDDNLAGLQSFLENKRVQVDDRDEVSGSFKKVFKNHSKVCVCETRNFKIIKL